MKVKHIEIPGQYGTRPLTECTYADENGVPMSARLPGKHTVESATRVINRERAILAQR